MRLGDCLPFCRLPLYWLSPIIILPLRVGRYLYIRIVSEAAVYFVSECHSENEIRPRDPIRCRECGYRIMYKKRTRRSIL